MKTIIKCHAGLMTLMFVLVSYSEEFKSEPNMLQEQPNASAFAGELGEVITLKSGVVVVKKGDLYFLGDDMLLTNEQVEILDETGNAFFSDTSEPIDTVGVEKIPAQVGMRYYYLNQIAEDDNQDYKDIGEKAFGNYPTAFNLWAMVRYTLDPSLSLWQLWSIADAITHIESVTNVRFYNATGQPTTLYGVSCDWINFIDCDTAASYSNVGRIGGMQVIGVNEWATDGVVAHEICHAVGLFHEHMRYDRDTYVNVNLSNVAPANQPNFTKITTNYSAIGSFDWNSIMLYSSYDFSNNGSPVMTRKDNGNTFVGQRTALSALDRNWINNLYLPYLPRLDTWVDLDATVYKPDNTVMTSLERENLIKSLNGGVLPPPPPAISGPDQACSPSYYTLTSSLPPQAGTIYWSLTGPFSFSSSSSVTTTTGNNTNVYKTASSGSGTLTARLGAANGPIIDTKAITPCPPSPIITGSTTLYLGYTYNFTVSNAPLGFTWDKSSNLSLSGSGTTVSVTATNGGSGWLSIKSGSTELVRFYVYVCTSAPVITSLDGPDNASPISTHYYSVSLYSYSDPVSYNWSLSGSGSCYLDANGSSASVNFYDAGTYCLSVSVSNACGYDYTYMYIYAGYSPSPIAPFPNPVNDILNIEITQQVIDYAKSKQQSGNNGKSTNANPVFDLRLYNEQGSMLRQTTTNKTGMVQFDVTNLPNGFYFLHIYDGVSDKPDMRTIVVQH